MKKRYRVYLAIATSLGIGYYVWYLLDTDGAVRFMKYIVEFINRPLPIVGFTVGALLIFIWRLIISLNYGKKKIAIYDQKIEELDKAYQEFVDKANSKIAYLEQENKELTTKLANACKLSTNKKIKDYGKELDAYGKETIECETKAE